MRAADPGKRILIKFMTKSSANRLVIDLGLLSGQEFTAVNSHEIYAPTDSVAECVDKTKAYDEKLTTKLHVDVRLSLWVVEAEFTSPWRRLVKWKLDAEKFRHHHNSCFRSRAISWGFSATSYE
jgi:hypothetical protein